VRRVSQRAEIYGRLAGNQAGWRTAMSRYLKTFIICRELGSKVRAFRLFRRAGAAPETALARASREDPWSRLFLLEGVGYAWGIAGRPLAAVDAEAAIPLTMGWGLAQAERAIESVKEGETPAESLGRLAAVCREHSPPGLAGVAFEGIGLVARMRSPHRVQLLARALAELGGDLEARFWHGLGRGLFFILKDAGPWGSPSGRALNRALREPPHDLGRANALAGLAWAMTLICLPLPEVLDLFLCQHSARIEDVEAFRQGIAAAALLWHGAAGRGTLLDRFLAHASQAPGRWRSWVRRPCERALGERFPALMQDGSWEDLFRVSR
jgi:hypothetical protein